MLETEIEGKEPSLRHIFMHTSALIPLTLPTGAPMKLRTTRRQPLFGKDSRDQTNLDNAVYDKLAESSLID